MRFTTLSLSLLGASLVAAQDANTKTTRTVTSTLTSTYVSTCTVLFATTEAAQPSAAMNYPLANGTVATTTPVPSASGTAAASGARTVATSVPYSGAASSAPQALFALAAGVLVLVASA